MSKYTQEIDYLIVGADISEEEIAEIITEADRITLENKETTEKIAEAYLKKSQCLQKLEKYKESELVIEKALELSPEMAEAITQLGNIFRNEKNYDEAIAYYTEAIRLKPDYAAAFNNRGASYDLKVDFLQTIADYTEAIRLRPDYAIAYYNRGNKYKELGQFEQARADWGEAIRLKPFLKHLVNREIIIFLSASEDTSDNEEIEQLTRAIYLNPDDATLFHNRGWFYAMCGEYDKTIAGGVEAIRLDPDSATGFEKRGKVYEKLLRKLDKVAKRQGLKRIIVMEAILQLNS
ncbi:tetratricopeptide repeat protein [Treponema primitia]|uniref:tetratricopeptide repeat protein n=1 Tax=Treponema primitia TaxID=88058 RepID=UPI0002D4A27F|nr:tetratricopeptide repeat protein [Treponema primitia]